MNDSKHSMHSSWLDQFKFWSQAADFFFLVFNTIDQKEQKDFEEIADS